MLNLYVIAGLNQSGASFFARILAGFLSVVESEYLVVDGKNKLSEYEDLFEIISTESFIDYNFSKKNCILVLGDRVEDPSFHIDRYGWNAASKNGINLVVFSLLASSSPKLHDLYVSQYDLVIPVQNYCDKSITMNENFIYIPKLSKYFMKILKGRELTFFSIADLSFMYRSRISKIFHDIYLLLSNELSLSYDLTPFSQLNKKKKSTLDIK